MGGGQPAGAVALEQHVVLALLVGATGIAAGLLQGDVWLRGYALWQLLPRHLRLGDRPQLRHRLPSQDECEQVLRSDRQPPGT